MTSQAHISGPETNPTFGFKHLCRVAGCPGDRAGGPFSILFDPDSIRFEPGPDAGFGRMLVPWPMFVATDS